MKSLNQYIIEKILINKSSKFNKIKVESRDHLFSIITERRNNNKSFIDLTDLDISELNDISYIFYGLNMEVVDISGWDTSNVITMENMFSFCDKLKNIIDEDSDTVVVKDDQMLYMKNKKTGKGVLVHFD